jgi:peroxiredoxin
MKVLIIIIVTLSQLSYAKTTTNWPPKIGEKFPKISFKDQRGILVDINNYRGKVIIMHMVGMTSPASHAFAGGAHFKKTLNEVDYQKNYKCFIHSFEKYSNLGEFSKNRNIHYIEAIYYDLNLKHPSASDAKKWFKHYGGRYKSKNYHVIAPIKDIRSQTTYNLIPGHILIDKAGIVRAIANNFTGNFWEEFLPLIKKYK